MTTETLFQERLLNDPQFPAAVEALRRVGLDGSQIVREIWENGCEAERDEARADLAEAHTMLGQVLWAIDHAEEHENLQQWAIVKEARDLLAKHSQ